ncbi:Mitochondrial intermembrane space import and assembly protein 40 [Meyerozyma sp. JA9]|nr:Mitochondrial intermembrane space import and assembly protein 40 [Meyerozyma sp. JA9]
MFRLLLNNARATMPRRSFARMYSAKAGSLTNNSRLYWGVGLSAVPAYIAFTQLEAVKNDAEVAASDSVKLASAEVDTKDAVPETPSEEDHSGAAYNPVTGEINWDCPCLGGMAHGPCGEEFKEAFACFVYSDSEPKGIDCITKFEVMRNCFREHPEHYKEELYDDDAASKAENEAAEAERATEEQAPEAEKATEKTTEKTTERAAETEATKPAKAKKASKPAEASASASA